MQEIKAPGRANLIGEHTDHTDGLVMPAAIDRWVSLEYETGGDEIALVSPDGDGGSEVVVDAAGDFMPVAGWGRYVAAVAQELTRLGRPAVGLRGRLSSNLPQGAGLSSSAALEVAVALSLCDVAEFRLEPMELAMACRRAENVAVGVPSGIMDQVASLLGRRGNALMLDCGSLEHRLVPLPADHDLLLVDSGVRRKLETSPYSDRIRELRAALPVLKGRRPAEVAPDEMDDILAQLEGVPQRRLRHVLSENLRVVTAEYALREGNLLLLGATFEESHASLREDFEVSTQELDTLVELARSAGATAARMTGGGFGGAILALTPSPESGRIASEIIEQYRTSHPNRSGATHICRTVDGASR